MVSFGFGSLFSIISRKETDTMFALIFSRVFLIFANVSYNNFILTLNLKKP